MPPILAKLPLIQVLPGTELHPFAGLVPLLALFLSLAQVEPTLVVPDHFLVGVGEGEDQAVLELLNDDAHQGLAGYGQGRDGEFVDDGQEEGGYLFVVALRVRVLGEEGELGERELISGNL